MYDDSFLAYCYRELNRLYFPRMLDDFIETAMINEDVSALEPYF